MRGLEMDKKGGTYTQRHTHRHTQTHTDTHRDIHIDTHRALFEPVLL
jgi:hypothetical protein